MSLATDFGISIPLEHGLQSTLIAMRLGKQLAWMAMSRRSPGESSASTVMSITLGRRPEGLCGLRLRPAERRARSDGPRTAEQLIGDRAEEDAGITPLRRQSDRLIATLDHSILQGHTSNDHNLLRFIASRATWERWREAGADVAVILARSPADVEAFVTAVNRW